MNQVERRKTIRLPNAVNEKTNYIKAFIRHLAKLQKVLNLSDEELLSSAEYYYQQAKYDPQEAAMLYGRS